MALDTFLILVETPWGGRHIFARAFPPDTSTQDALDSTILAYYQTRRPTYYTGDYIIAYRWDIGIVCASKEENSMTIHGGLMEPSTRVLVNQICSKTLYHSIPHPPPR